MNHAICKRFTEGYWKLMRGIERLIVHFRKTHIWCKIHQFAKTIQYVLENSLKRKFRIQDPRLPSFKSSAAVHYALSCRAADHMSCLLARHGVAWQTVYKCDKQL